MSAGASVQPTTGSRGVRISGSNAGYTMFRGSVKSTGYPLHTLVSASLPLPCVTVCHHISAGLYRMCIRTKVMSVFLLHLICTLNLPVYRFHYNTGYTNRLLHLSLSSPCHLQIQVQRLSRSTGFTGIYLPSFRVIHRLRVFSRLSPQFPGYCVVRCFIILVLSDDGS